MRSLAPAPCGPLLPFTLTHPALSRWFALLSPYCPNKRRPRSRSDAHARIGCSFSTVIRLDSQTTLLPPAPPTGLLLICGAFRSLTLLRSFKRRHAWLNLRGKRTTTGRINQVASLSLFRSFRCLLLPLLVLLLCPRVCLCVCGPSHHSRGSWPPLTHTPTRAHAAPTQRQPSACGLPFTHTLSHIATPSFGSWLPSFSIFYSLFPLALALLLLLLLPSLLLLSLPLLLSQPPASHITQPNALAHSHITSRPRKQRKPSLPSLCIRPC